MWRCVLQVVGAGERTNAQTPRRSNPLKLLDQRDHLGRPSPGLDALLPTGSSVDPYLFCSRFPHLASATVEHELPYAGECNHTGKVCQTKRRRAYHLSLYYNCGTMG